MMLKWAKLLLLFWKVPFITGSQYREILSNEPGYEASYLLTSNLLIMPLKLDKPQSCWV